jgi:uncharacterized MAPEG superfamily protein
MNYIDMLLGKLIEWIDMILNGIKTATGEHSQWIPIVAIIYLATRIFNIKLNLGGKR